MFNDCLNNRPLGHKGFKDSPSGVISFLWKTAQSFYQKHVWQNILKNQQNFRDNASEIGTQFQTGQTLGFASTCEKSKCIQILFRHFLLIWLPQSQLQKYLITNTFCHQSQ